MKLNIIFDDRRVEKYEPLIGELKRQGITDYEIWPCILRPNVVESINASHKMIVRDAKEKELDEVFIAEDDLMFPAKDGWSYFIKNKPKPEDYDIYLAATYVPPISNNIICGFHLYAVSAKFYDKFLSIPDKEHIDTAANDLKGNWVFCYPFAALQRPGFSANNSVGSGHIVNYNRMIKDEDVYGGIPR